MIFNPDTGMNPHKEVILQRSPFTKIFLDKQMPYDTTMWLAYLAPAEDKINRELQTILGADWEKTSMAPLAVVVNNLHIFDPKFPSEAVYATTKSVVEIGYEVGNNDDCTTLLTDVAVQLRDTGALDQDALASQEARLKTVDAVDGLLTAGVYFRSLSKPGGTSTIGQSPVESPPDDDHLQVFDDFLKGLK